MKWIALEEQWQTRYKGYDQGFNPYYEMDSSGSQVNKHDCINVVTVSILIMKWIALEEQLDTSLSLYLNSFNPYYEMDSSGSLQSNTFYFVKLQFQSLL